MIEGKKMSLLPEYYTEFLKDLVYFKGDTSKVLEPKIIVQRLRRLTQPEQLSEQWYSMRREMITASSAAALIPKQKKYMKPYYREYRLPEVFPDSPAQRQKQAAKGCNPYSSRREYFLTKCGHRSFQGNAATRWGQKYEDVVQAIYSRHIGEHIYNFGLLPHPYLKYLGASPDGISENGTMLEIKVPYRRTITGIPPIYYWIQVQLQLEVCQLEQCAFVECKISEYDSEEKWLAEDPSDIPGGQKGLILQTGQDTYKYPPCDMTKPDDLLTWARENTARNSGNKNVYWRLDQICITMIRRDRKWFKRIRPCLYFGYLELRRHQKNNAADLLKDPSKTLDLRQYVNPAVDASTKSVIKQTVWDSSEEDE